MRRAVLLFATVGTALVLASGMALAAAGALDKSFGKGGKVVAPYGTDSGAGDVVIQPDGKTVATGFVENRDGETALLVRYNADGGLDRRFGENGKVKIADLSATDVKRQPDGKIVVSGRGSVADDCCHIVVRRYNPNGAPDRSFGGDGKVVTRIANSEDGGAEALIVQEDGKIVAAGYDLGSDFTYRTALVRYNPDGTPDETFGEDGTVVVHVDGQQFGAEALAEHAGKLVTANDCNGQGKKDCGFTVARFDTNGDLDGSFSGDGQATVDMESTYRLYEIENATAVAVQQDGKVVVSGYSFRGRPLRYQFALARFTVSGALDESFGGDGKVFADPEPKGRANGLAFGLALQGDKIVAAGYVCCNRDFVLVRFDANGDADRSFSGDGSAVASFRGSGDMANDVALRNGKIVSVGSAYVYPGSDRTDAFALARFQAR